MKIVSLLHLESWCHCFDWGWGAVRFAVCEWHLLSWCTENHDGGKLLLSIFLFWAVLFCARNGKRTIHCSRGTLSNIYSDSKKKNKPLLPLTKLGRGRWKAWSPWYCFSGLGRGLEGGCSCCGWKRPPGGQGANTHLPPVPVGRQLCEVWLRGLWSCVRMPGG